MGNKMRNVIALCGAGARRGCGRVQQQHQQQQQHQYRRRRRRRLNRLAGKHQRRRARIAEKVATADILTRGRIEWGTGRSTPMERSAAFGVPEDRNKEMWREAVATIVEMWESERFSSDTEFLTMPARAITPKPYQWPHPPAWLAAVSDDSAIAAGYHQLGLLLMAILTRSTWCGAG